MEFNTEEFHSLYVPIQAKIRQNNHIYMKNYMSFSQHLEHILLYIYQNENNFQ